MTSSAQNGTLLVLKLKRVAAESSNANVGMRSAPNTFGPSLPGNLIELPVSMKSEKFQPSLDMLVVEDDDHNWMLLLSWLPKYVGARRAINGREAVDALTMRRPDLVIMDLEMPVMNGFEAIHRIREMQASASEEPSVIYAFTGYDDQETTKRIRAAGFDGILGKSVRHDEFEDVLRMISSMSRSAVVQGELWIEKNFVDAFPTFVESRLALISDIERAAHASDMSAMRRAAHTLAGSPAIHGFSVGVSICRRIIAMAGSQDLREIGNLVGELRKMFYKPVIR